MPTYMMTHLTEREINGYIHHTLTDAQRETMNRHMQDCPDCRVQVQAAEHLRRQMAYDLAEEIRHSRPSAQMGFRQIRPELNRRRRWATLRFHSMQMLSALGTVTAVGAFIFLTLYLLGTSSIGSPAPVTVEEIIAAADIVKLFDEAWDDPMPYQDGLIATEQQALNMLAYAPVYHIDMTVSDDLQRVNGRQQLRYVNITGESLSDLVFHLYPNLAGASLAVYDVEINGRPVEHHQVAGDAYLQIRLPHTLQPGDAVIVEMAFELVAGDIWRPPLSQVLYLVQFNPTLAMYDKIQGWDMGRATHGLLPNAVPSFYRVRVTAPDRQVVIASGTITGRETVHEDGLTREVMAIAAGPVGEMALSISPRFQAALSDVVGETRINSYAHTVDQLDNARHALDNVRAALLLYGQLFGPYPYTELDVTNVPSLAFASQGAAYSGMIWLEHDAFLFYPDGRDQMVFFQVATQWFDPAISGARLESPWLADGLAEYATRYVYEAYESDTAVLELYERWQKRVQPGAPAITLPAAAYDQYTYYNVMHGQAPLFLAALAEAIGQAQFNGLLADYVQTYRWGGADAAAFRQLAESHCGCRLAAVFADNLSNP